jgi:arsenite methyltransferase
MLNIAGALTAVPGFTIEKGIARQKSVYSPAQTQTQDAFGFKWKKRDTYESDAVQQASKAWLLERYVVPGRSLREVVTGKRVLDAGCGSGHSALLFFDGLLKDCDYVGVDISTAVDVAKQRFSERGLPGQFLQASLLDLPKEIGEFDVIFSEGVLHHTDSTRAAVLYLARRLKPGGTFMFYIYKKKGPIREFTDDYIREQLSNMTDEAAWDALMPLSQLGKDLGDLNIKINIKEPIEVLSIPTGEIDLQRLFYWHIFKAYHKPDWTMDELNHINFDWYRPKNCLRQTPEEVAAWVGEAGMKMINMRVEDAGITVIAEKT